ncbi:MAG: hypothetical protein KA807_19670 [Prolixibacteraceae bacterium]|nr:hypothetical protein [Prolixibacteraceae bacterium]
MILQCVEKEEPFTSLYYELTWPIGWNQIISFFDIIIKTDFLNGKGNVASISVGFIAGAEPVDVTKDLINHKYEIKRTDFAQKELGYVILAGESSFMDIPIRFTLWNQLDKCLVQLMNDDKIEKLGKNTYDKYMNSIEIRGHMDYVLSNKENNKKESVFAHILNKIMR